MRFEIFHINWEQGDNLDREVRRDLTEGVYERPEDIANAVSFMETSYDKIAIVELPDGWDLADGCEVCFILTNSIERPWIENVDPRVVWAIRSRSTSVGDLIRIKTSANKLVEFYCAPIGFIRLP